LVGHLSPCMERNCSVHGATLPGPGKQVDLQQMKRFGRH
jgi:hypothetical protein